MTKAFAKAIRTLIKTELDIAALFEPGGAYHLSNLVERCFLQEDTALSREQKAVIILSRLFSSLVPTFRFDRLLTQVTSAKERKAFLTLLLHHLFGCNFPLHALVSRQACNSYLIQQLASLASETTVTQVWNALSFTGKVKTLGLCYKHYEEGSYFLAQIAKKESAFNKFCDYIDRGLISRQALFDWVAMGRTISKQRFALFFDQQKTEIKRKTSQIRAVLQKKYTVKISIANLSKFISIFGLYNFQGASEASLDQLLQMDNESSSHIAKALCSTLHAYLEKPPVYNEQMKKLVLALPTSSRTLERLPWLSSMLSCLRYLMLCLPCPEMAIKDYPIFVFDQSEPKPFQKNARYIAALNKDYRASIIHLSTKQVVTLSKKLAIEKMIITAPNDYFGYGGARNTAFLIAPVLHAMFQKHGRACIAKALLTPENELQRLFKEVVCSENALTIHMGEDDLWEPPATLISDILFASCNKQDYFFRMGSCIGRDTAYVQGCFDARNLLYGCRSLYSQFAWSEKQTLTGMRGILTKPKICLNLPFGNEEAHLQAQKNTFFDFRRNAIHFSGWRYPKEDIPTSHYAGIARFLRSHNPYVFGLRLTEELLRLVDYATTPLVWNKRKKPFSSLQEAIDNMVDEKSTKAMQKQFWANLSEYLLGFTAESQKVTTANLMHDLLACNIEQHDSTLKDYFQELVQQAKEYKEFATIVVAEMKKQKNPKMAIDRAKKSVESYFRKPIERMSFAHTLYLICLSVGAGGFQEALKAMDRGRSR